MIGSKELISSWAFVWKEDAIFESSVKPYLGAFLAFVSMRRKMVDLPLLARPMICTVHGNGIRSRSKGASMTRQDILRC